MASHTLASGNVTKLTLCDLKQLFAAKSKAGCAKSHLRLTTCCQVDTDVLGNFLGYFILRTI